MQLLMMPICIFKSLIIHLVKNLLPWEWRDIIFPWGKGNFVNKARSAPKILVTVWEFRPPPPFPPLLVKRKMARGRALTWPGLPLLPAPVFRTYITLCPPPSGLDTPGYSDVFAFFGNVGARSACGHCPVGEYYSRTNQHISASRGVFLRGGQRGLTTKPNPE